MNLKQLENWNLERVFNLLVLLVNLSFQKRVKKVLWDLHLMGKQRIIIKLEKLSKNLKILLSSILKRIMVLYMIRYIL